MLIILISRYLTRRINNAASRLINGITRGTQRNLEIGRGLVDEFLHENRIQLGPLQRNHMTLNAARTHLITPIAEPSTFVYQQLGSLDRMVNINNVRLLHKIKML